MSTLYSSSIFEIGIPFFSQLSTEWRRVSASVDVFVSIATELCQSFVLSKFAAGHAAVPPQPVGLQRRWSEHSGSCGGLNAAFADSSGVVVESFVVFFVCLKQ